MTGQVQLSQQSTGLQFKFCSSSLLMPWEAVESPQSWGPCTHVRVLEQRHESQV